MKACRPVVAAAMLIILACLTGCGTTVFFFSFTEELAITNDEYTWITEGSGSMGVAIQGLWMDERTVIFPFRLEGNSTIELNIASACGDTELAYIKVMLTDAENPFASYHSLEMYLGNPSDQIVKLCEKGSSYVNRVLMGPEIPGLENPGDNEIVINKAGNSYNCFINGTLVGGYNAEDFFADWYLVAIYCELNPSTDAESLFIEDFSLKVSGECEGIL